MPPSDVDPELIGDVLFEAFTSAALPADQFHHEQHVRVAWMFVCRHGMPAAIGEFSQAIKRFAAAKGAHGLYHETITWAFLLLISERQARQPSVTWAEFAEANVDLLSWKPSILERYYSTELLASELARRAFVMPDNTEVKHEGSNTGVQTRGFKHVGSITRVREPP